MTVSHFDNIRVVLAEPNSQLRTELKDNLEDLGFRNVVATGNMSRIVSEVKAGSVDLIIADTSLPEGDFNQYVRELRHGRHGDNPFLVVITMVNEAKKAAVHAAINSGTDHVVAKPFSVASLIDKVNELTHTRKRFVVTSDYIGPDRRKAHRPGTMEVPLIVVPNPLQHRKLGGASETQMKRRVESAKQKINEQKVLRNAYQIGWLLDFVMPEIAALNADMSANEPENLLRLRDTANDMCARIRGTQFAHMAEMCLTLGRMAEEALKSGLCDADMRLMGRMAGIIENIFDPERDARATDYQRQRRNAGYSSDMDKSEPTMFKGTPGPKIQPDATVA